MPRRRSSELRRGWDTHDNAEHAKRIAPAPPHEHPAIEITIPAERLNVAAGLKALLTQTDKCLVWFAPGWTKFHREEPDRAQSGTKPHIKARFSHPLYSAELHSLRLSGRQDRSPTVPANRLPLITKKRTPAGGFARPGFGSANGG
jgi:hypothetical protein